MTSPSAASVAAICVMLALTHRRTAGRSRSRRRRQRLRGPGARRRHHPVHRDGDAAAAVVASVYSVRPKPGAPVSTPLSWDEVNDRLNPSIYTMDVVLERVGEKGDLYAGVLTTRQSLSKALKSLA